MKNSTFINSNNTVIDKTASHSTQPASWQVAGYPAQAGIQQKQKAAQRTKSRAAGNASTNWMDVPRNFGLLPRFPACAGMTNGGVKALVLALAAIGLATLPTHDALANPQGGQVVAGSATIVQQTPTKVGITQTTDKAIIDWQKFSIGANEHVQYYQPSAASVTLNRVVGADPSQILGRLTANGQVFLVNPNGIYFGKNAQIDVAGLVASTHNIRNEDFLAGKYIFNIPGKPGAAVINDGSIHIADTGIAAFVAPSVLNNGVIVAKLGKVMLASANGFTLDFSGDQLITFLVNDQVAQTAFDLQGNLLGSFVENAGRIEAQGGYVLLTAKAAESAIHSVINQTGSIEATTVGTHNGTIILNAGTGSLNVAGTLDASAPIGGDGGYIDTSGAHVTVDPTAKITTAAPFGKTGTWLLDPVDFTIAATGGDMTGTALSSALGLNNVFIQSVSGGSGTAGDVNVNDIVTWSANKLTLNAQNNININANLNGSGTASLALEYGQGALAAGNLSDYLVHAAVNLPAGQNFSTKLGSDGAVKNYTVITSLGAAGGMTGTDLQGMRGNLAGSYVLGANIDAAATAAWNAGAGFSPLGYAPRNSFGNPIGTGFSGVLDGLGHTISNLYVNRPADFDSSLLGYVSGATVSNLGLLNANVTGYMAIGALAGFTPGTTFKNTYSTGNVMGTLQVGGLVGSNAGLITKSYSLASVSATGYTPNGMFGTTGSTAGGLVGVNWYGTVSESYSAGTVTGNSIVGGLIGDNIGAVTNSYWDVTTSGQATSAGGTGLTTAQMMTQASFTGFDFANNWYMIEGNTRPFLRSEYSTTISNAHQLQLMSMNLGASYTLANNINMSELASPSGMWNTSTGFVPIGDAVNSFSGVLDGASNTISNLFINRPATVSVGMFTTISGQIKNLGLVNANVTGNNGTGLLASSNTGSIADSYVTGSVTGGWTTGGLVASNSGTITRSYSTANVIALRDAGGLTGSNVGTISDSYATGSVTGKTSSYYALGSLVGVIYGNSVITNSFATGSVSSPGGGLAGYFCAGWDCPAYVGSITNSYWNTQTVGQNNWTNTAFGAGLTTAQMQNQSSFAGWDFVNTWEILPGATHPTLKAHVQAVTPVTPPVTPPVMPSTLTPAQQQLVTAHKGDSVFQLLTAIADGLFTNSNTDPVWVGMYQSVGSAAPTATAIQRAANAQRNIYDAYTAADIFAQIRAGTLINSTTDNVWHSIYRNGHALQTQVDANTFDVTYNNYKGKTSVALFNGIVAGDLSTNPAASNAVVWQALRVASQTSVGATAKAAQMAGIYDTYKISNVAALLAGLRSTTLVEGNTVWNALLAVNAANMSSALSQYKAVAVTPVTPSNQTQALIAKYKGKDAATLFDGMLMGDFGSPWAYNNYQDLTNNPVWIALHNSSGQLTQEQKDAFSAYIMYQSFGNGISPSALALGKRLYDAPDLVSGLAWPAFVQEMPAAAAAALKVRDDLVKARTEADKVAKQQENTTPPVSNSPVVDTNNLPPTGTGNSGAASGSKVQGSTPTIIHSSNSFFGDLFVGEVISSFDENGFLKISNDRNEAVSAYITDSSGKVIASLVVPGKVDSEFGTASDIVFNYGFGLTSAIDNLSSGISASGISIKTAINVKNLPAGTTIRYVSGTNTANAFTLLNAGLKAFTATNKIVTAGTPVEVEKIIKSTFFSDALKDPELLLSMASLLSTNPLPSAWDLTKNAGKIYMAYVEKNYTKLMATVVTQAVKEEILLSAEAAQKFVLPLESMKVLSQTLSGVEGELSALSTSITVSANKEIGARIISTDLVGNDFGASYSPAQL